MRHRIPTTAIFAGLVLLSAGVVVGLLVAQRTPPESASTPSAPIAPVTVVAFDDSRLAELAVTTDGGFELTSLREGIVTASSCVAGGRIASGERPWSVDGRALVALQTAVPLYRDLKAGDSGTDVTGLLAELRRLEIVDPGSNTLRKSDIDAVGAYASDASSGRGEEDVIALADIVWLPRSPVQIQDCRVPLGARTAGTLAVTTPIITRLAVKNWPTDLVSGDRVLTVDGASFPIHDDEGSVVDPDALAELANLPSARLALQTANTDVAVPLQATISLADPLSTATIPASAVIVDGGATCVVDVEGWVHPVRVVASELGRSIVEFPDQWPDQVRAAPDGTRCRSD